MKRCLLACVLALAWLATAGPRSEAQVGSLRPQTNPFGQPAISPYLNLNRAGTTAGINYYGLVRPQLDTNRSLQQLQQQYAFGQNGMQTNDTVSVLSNTGHSVRFMNTGSYFSSIPNGRTGTGTGGQNTQSFIRPLR